MEKYRKANLRLRLLLFGDGMETPGFIRGDEPRSRVSTELRHMREAFDAALEEDGARAEQRQPSAVAPSELRRAPSGPAGSQQIGDEVSLLTAAEAAELLGVSVSTIYRAVRQGDIPAVRPSGNRRGALRIPTSELRTKLALPRA